MRRPPSIWLTQGIITIFALSFLSGVLRSIFLSHFEVSGHLLRLIMITSLLAIWIGAVWGLARRTQWGKWLGVLSLALLLGGIIYNSYFPVSGSVRKFEYSNDAQRAGGRDGAIMIQLSLILLMSRLVFSKKVNGYFYNYPIVLKTSQQPETESTPNENI